MLRVESRETRVESRKMHLRFRRVRRRGGISLTEVLIAMGILTLGLLGVMAMFPVGSFYMQEAEIADRGAAVGRQVMSDLLAKGMLDPKSWRMLSSAPAIASADIGSLNTYGRSVGLGMANDWAASTIAPTGDIRAKQMAQRYGSCYVIDPIGVAAASLAIIPHTSNLAASPFPAEAYGYPVAGSAYASTKKWLTWTPPGPAAPQSPFWPIRRVTIHQSNPLPTPANPSYRMDGRVAELLFGCNDDLSFEVPEQGDKPAVQLWDTSSLSTPLARQWVGDYSWLVTVAPTSGPAELAIGRSAENQAYDVSVVVFYKRPINHKSPQGVPEMNPLVADMQTRERVVRGRVISKGPNGGELFLEQLGAWTGPSPYAQLRTGEWVMICGPHPSSSDAAPRFALNWYKVMAIDSELNGIITDVNRQRIVTLRGPEWPWQPAVNGLGDNTDLSNDLCVGIMPGAVAVHSKTIRLESTSGTFSSAQPAAAANPFASLR